MIYLLVFSILNISNRLKHSNAYVTLDLVLLIQMKMKLEIEYNIYILSSNYVFCARAHFRFI